MIAVSKQTLNYSSCVKRFILGNQLKMLYLTHGIGYGGKGARRDLINLLTTHFPLYKNF